ncbi:alcohol dehydrogenase [Sporosarcina sp. P21c]|uniref:iron-containing alcohol dehydrogenase n=1 Tax=unclassified Sporosarcina TaxID=2647733 RepID=UPI000C16EE5E|nr:MULTISPECIES: iron-containing alcohol dehydrogenase [unclassified Sporosarcina]PIC68054.1 alcohol dehydrogenase [Sporosarcina sp. P16a]PIC90979.1 alcohol dehydrogenase [Sporosarcina sp. P21c]PIC94363.1 alcohol dehydrogenase [Sporosarcina sp. P25]
METCKTFQMPPTILYQQNSFAQIGEKAVHLGKKALIISDQIMQNLGYVEECQRELLEHSVKSVVFLGVASEPNDQYVEDALQLYQDETCDLIISLGGGSCIDTAKAVAVVATNGGNIEDYVGMKKIAQIAPVPHIAIPTTAGTGSEATDVTVITNSATTVKMMIKQPAFMPNVAIVDPLLTLSSPQKVTAATGVDALSHAIEAYISKKSHPMTDMMALSAIKLISKNLYQAFTDGQNIEAREGMSLAALQAGSAFSNASVCLIHGMSRPIGALFDVPHGFSNAMLLPAILEYSKDACIDRLADIGRIFSSEAEQVSDEAAAEIAVQSVKDLCKALAIPNLEQWGIPRAEFVSAISKMSTDAIASGSPSNNPKTPSKEEIAELYQVCYEYQF